MFIQTQNFQVASLWLFTGQN